MKYDIELTVNGRLHRVSVEPTQTLLDLLRDELRYTGSKFGCGRGQCGACTVHMDGKPVNSCLVLAVEANKRNILTIEGLAKNGQLHPIQSAFIEHGAVQCGYCTPGMIMSAKSLLDENPHPTELEVMEAISGNLCRCTGYTKIVKAILAVAEKGK